MTEELQVDKFSKLARKLGRGAQTANETNARKLAEVGPPAGGDVE